jgi:hypothetical protein
VTPWQNICEVCGTANPATVPVSPGVLVTILISVAFLLLFSLT